MNKVVPMVRPVSTLPAGKVVSVVLRNGQHVLANTTMVYVADAAGVIAYDRKTRAAIPRENIQGWYL